MTPREKKTWLNSARPAARSACADAAQYSPGGPIVSWLAAVLLLLVSACTTHRMPPVVVDATGPVSWVERQLRHSAAQWVGVPYRYGGQGPRGIDCSALVARIYAAAFQLQLPRTVRRQLQVGRPVGRGPLAPGDIVFFRGGIWDIHAGIYLGRGEFVHASTRRGVTVSNINTRYWRRHYLAARRLIAAGTF